MNVHDTAALAGQAVAANPSRAATMVIHDSPDARAIIFRIAPGQVVAVHTNPSTVMLTVMSGRGIVSGGDGEREVKAGDLVTYAPDEPHGMRATTEQLVLLAVIAPRPGPNTYGLKGKKEQGAA